jgi:CubicO group peptidase (beta-lactamase class C family)
MRLLPLLLLAACGMSRMERVEHGLIPELRVAGERGGWSIEERLRAHHTPAVSIAIIHDYRVVWAKAYGIRDRRSGERAEPSTPFQAASISKMVTGMAALQAVEAGKVSLDADINQALRGWKLPESPLTQDNPVTLKQLLAHTSGVGVRSVSGYLRGAPLPTLPQILDGVPPTKTRAVRVEHQPGKEFHYSGGGSMIVQQLIIDVAGRSFADALEATVFAPLGMTHSSFQVQLPQQGLAAAHDVDETVLPELVYPESAPAGLWSTPSDLARFLIEIQLGLLGKSKVVSPELARRMTTPVAPIGVPGVSTGLGTFIEEKGDAVYFGHDGHNDGFLSVSRATTRGGEGAVVMTNGAGGTQLILEILRSIAVEYQWKGWLKPPVRAVRLPRARLSAREGRFRAGPDGALSIVLSGDHLEAREPFKGPQPLIPLADDSFVSRDDTRFQFRGDQLVATPHDGEPLVMARVTDDSVEPLRLLESGREEEALLRYRALLASHPKDPGLSEARFDDLALDLLESRFDLPNAIRVFRVEAALYPDSAYANAGMALACLRAGKREEAAPFRARALALLERERSELEGLYLRLRMGRIERLW